MIIEAEKRAIQHKDRSDQQTHSKPPEVPSGYREENKKGS